MSDHARVNRRRSRELSVHPGPPPPPLPDLCRLFLLCWTFANQASGPKGPSKLTTKRNCHEADWMIHDARWLPHAVQLWPNGFARRYGQREQLVLTGPSTIAIGLTINHTSPLLTALLRTSALSYPNGPLLGEGGSGRACRRSGRPLTLTTIDRPRGAGHLEHNGRGALVVPLLARSLTAEIKYSLEEM